MDTHDRTLRQMVGQLAEMRNRDRETVLASLSSTPRDCVERLLVSYDGIQRDLSQEVQAHDTDIPDGLSPWLVERIIGTSEGPPMTPHAIAALRSCLSANRPSTTAPASLPSRTFIAKLCSLARAKRPTACLAAKRMAWGVCSPSNSKPPISTCHNNSVN